MNKEDAHKEIERLQEESARLDGWAAILDSDKGKGGKFLKGELNQRINQVRHRYVDIDVRNPDKSAVVEQLVMLQTRERTYQELLADMSDLQNRKNDVDKHIASVVEGISVIEEYEPLARQPE